MQEPKVLELSHFQLWINTEFDAIPPGHPAYVTSLWDPPDDGLHNVFWGGLNERTFTDHASDPTQSHRLAKTRGWKYLCQKGFQCDRVKITVCYVAVDLEEALQALCVRGHSVEKLSQLSQNSSPVYIWRRYRGI